MRVNVPFERGYEYHLRLFLKQKVIRSEYIYPELGSLSLYGCILLFILLHASKTAAPFISDPELAAVGDVFGT